MIMYFKNNITINESTSVTMANLMDYLYFQAMNIFSSSSYSYNYRVHVATKMERAKRLFAYYYNLEMYDNGVYCIPVEAEKYIQKFIDDYNEKSKVDEVLDLNKIEKFMRIRLEQKLSNNKRYRELPLYVIYNQMTREGVHEDLPNEKTTLTLSLIFGSGNPVFIQFDEESIKEVLTLATKNNWLMEEKIYPVKLNVNLEKLNKMLKSKIKNR